MKTTTTTNISIVLAMALFLSFKSNTQTNNRSLTSPKQNNMKEFILLNRVPLNYGPDDAKAVIATWNNLTDKWKADGIFVSSFVFPREGYVVSGSAKNVTKETIASNNLKIVSCIIINAISFDEAVAQAKACPILEQGGSVEISEVQARPAQAKN